MPHLFAWTSTPEEMLKQIQHRKRTVKIDLNEFEEYNATVMEAFAEVNKFISQQF